MKAADNQHETASPIYMRDRRISALQAEPNAPLNIFSPLVEDSQQHEAAQDRRKGIEAAQEATARRLRLQTTQLKRFRQQICLRVNERAVEQRELRQSLEKRVGAKLARLLQLPSAVAVPSQAEQNHPSTPPPLRLSRRAFADGLLRETREQLKQCSAPVVSLVEKAMRSDAQAREMLLQSTRLTRVRGARECEEVALEAEEREDDNLQTHDTSRRSDVDLPLKQRKELYAAVRRQFMAAERERVQERGRGVRAGPGHSRPPLKNYTGRPAENRINIVDGSVGCEVKMHRQSAKPSPTTWRKRFEGQQTPSSVEPKEQKINERFLNALQEELGTPALCSCRKQRGRIECANNCEFYRQPKKKERAVASVCKQHDISKWPYQESTTQS